MASPYGLRIIENCLVCKPQPGRLFCNLSPDSLRAFDAIKCSATYPSGALLFMEGQASIGIFMLCKGGVKLSTSSAEGRTLIVKVAEPGEVLGLSAAISGRPYPLTAEVTESSQINFVRRADFVRFLREHGDACLHAVDALSGQYNDACHEIRSIGLSHSAAEKLARVLLDWAARGRDVTGIVRVKITLSHDEIAQLIGTSRETVTRMLGEFKRKNLLEIQGSTLIIHDQPALEQLIAA